MEIEIGKGETLDIDLDYLPKTVIPREETSDPSTELDGESDEPKEESVPSHTDTQGIDTGLAEAVAVDPLLGKTYSRVGGLDIKPTTKRKKIPVKKFTEASIEGAFNSQLNEKAEETMTIASSILDDNLHISYDETIDWGDFNVNNLVEKMVLFSRTLNGIPLYPYQEDFQRRIFRSVLVNDGEELTACISRQSGKSETVAQTCNTLMVLVPKLAEIFPNQLGTFKKGFRIGLFAPTSEQARTLHARMDERLSGEEAAEVLSDPDISAEKKYAGGVLVVSGPSKVLPSGRVVPSFVSFCRLQSASQQSKVESKTYDLIIIDEAQEVSTIKVQKSIRPMLASTNGTLIQIGTPTYTVSDFYYAIQRNIRKRNKLGIQNHFEYDYRVCQRYNDKYKAYVKKERERLGEDSDAFQLSYCLKWLIEKGMAVTPQMFEEYLKYPSGRFEYTRMNGEHYVGGLDLAKESDSTVLTIGKIIPVAETTEDGSVTEKYVKVIVNWIEMTGDNWEVQFQTILDAVFAFKLEILCVDSTGVGDPICDRLEAALEDTQCDVFPVTYTLKEKHNMAVLFYSEMRRQRIRIPTHQSVTKTRRFRNFQDQLFSCVKTYHKSYMQIEHPPKEKDAHDDYVNSLLLLCHGVEQRFQSAIRVYSDEVEMGSDLGDVLPRHSKRYEQAMSRIQEQKARWRKKDLL